MDNRILAVKNEVKRAIIGKDDAIDKVMTAIIAGGHILLEDIPGVGKTTMALAFSKAMGMHFKRVQFTPDVVPSDITGFTMYDKSTGEFKYTAGAVITNFLLADEINRTSSKTQSALLEVMQEGKVTVDGKTYKLPEPFIVVATQNPIGTAGTQMLPESQLDRFMVQLSIGYPSAEDQAKILKDRSLQDPLSTVRTVVTKEDILQMKSQAKMMFVDDKIYGYISALAEATRKHEFVRLGLSPRGALALADMAKADAYIKGQDFVAPENIQNVFKDVCAHRLVLQPKAQLTGVTKENILDEIISSNKAVR
ncbi:MAG: MoxR family ATPase [Firmicutes bacterium]|nr:MoxR family ATPase [Bacillota bacterium]